MTKRLLIFFTVLVLAACGGTATSTTEDGTTDAGDTTTTEDSTATTVAEDEGPTETVDISDMPQECIDAFVEFLQVIEPVVSDFDFQNASLDDMEAMGTELEEVSAQPTAEMEGLNCPDLDGTDEEAFAAMIEIAENEAPGTVGYFRWIEELGAAMGEGGTGVSGDCETDIEALEAIIAEKETMGSLTMVELSQVGSLMTSVSTECSLERTTEFFEQPEVEAFVGSGG